MKELREVVIDRSKWACYGHDADGIPQLLSPLTGKMCCLGFDALQQGYTETDILNKDCPAELEWRPMSGRRKNTTEYDYDGCLSWAQEAMSANDKILDDAEREKAVAKAFKKGGRKAIFVGEYPK